MTKEYRFYCKKCNGYYTTKDKKMPICRGCQGILPARFYIGNPRDNIIEEFGRPVPTLLQATQWNATREAIRLIKESENGTSGEMNYE